MAKFPALKIYTDGSRIGQQNVGRGGWAFYLPQLKKGYFGSVPKATSAQMELLAIIESLKFLTPTLLQRYSCETIRIYTDCQPILRAILHPEYRVDNVRYWRAYQRALKAVIKQGVRVEFYWVKGHATSPENRQADKLARAAAKSQV